MANQIEQVSPPALPNAPIDYDRLYENQSNNILRLFFTRLVNVLRSLLSTNDGGRFLYFPRGLFYSTVDQTAALVNTGYAVDYENTYIGNGVSIQNNSQVTVSADGVYNFQLTLQVDHTNSSSCTLWVWISKNGVAVPYGGQEHTISGNSLQVVHWNFSIDLNAGEYIEMYWATDDTALYVHTHAPAVPHPGVPSVVLAVSFVSNL